MKKLSIWISLRATVVGLVALAPVLVLAQTIPPIPAPPDSLQTLMTPQVFVTNLTLDKTSVAPGGVVTGTVDFINRGNAPSSDVYYNVMLVGNFTDRIPQDIYDISIRGPVSLDVSEQKTVHFTYTIPQGFSGTDRGIRVQATLKSGIRMGWADVKFAITGAESSLLDAGSAFLTVGKAVYMPDSGPTLLDGQSVAYNVTLINKGIQATVVTPHIVLYRYGDNATVVSDTKGDKISVPAGTKKVTVALPGMNGKPGVYFGNLTFVDASGVVKSQVMTFRYIVDGSLVTIQGVSLDTTKVTAGNTAAVAVTFTGAPINIADGTRPWVGTIDLTVVALDPAGKEIGRATQKVDASGSVSTAIVPVSFTDGADGMQFEITAQKDGAVLSHYQSNILKPVQTVPGTATAATDFVGLLTIIVILVVVAIVGFVIVLMRRSGGNLPPPVADIGGTLAIILVICAGIGLVSPATLQAFVRPPSASTWQPLFINNPYDNQEFSPEDQFYLEGVAMFSECNNGDFGLHQLAVTYNGVTLAPYTVGAANPATEHSSPFSVASIVNDIFSVGPFTAPSTPGTYRMDITYSVDLSYEGEFIETKSDNVYVDTVVGASDAGPDLYQSSSVAPCGGYSGLRWYSVSGADKYQLYRDDGVTPIYNGSGLSYLDHVAGNTTHSYHMVPVDSSDNPVGAETNPISVMASNYCPLNVSVFFYPTPAVVGQTTWWTASISGGSGSYALSWSGSGGLTGNTKVVNWVYTTEGSDSCVNPLSGINGNISGTVAVTDKVTGNVKTDTGCGDVFAVSSTGYNSIQCSASPANAFVGQTVTWTVTTDQDPLGGGYTYTWQGSDGLSGNTKSVKKVYSTVGLKHSEVSIDATGGPLTVDCVATTTIRVNPNIEEF